MMQLVTTLKTQPERQREAIGSMITRLTAAHARGEVAALTFVYIEKDTCIFEISSDTYLSRFAFLVATLQAELTKWMHKS